MADSAKEVLTFCPNAKESRTVALWKKKKRTTTLLAIRQNVSMELDGKNISLLFIGTQETHNINSVQYYTGYDTIVITLKSKVK